MTSTVNCHYVQGSKNLHKSVISTFHCCWTATYFSIYVILNSPYRILPVAEDASVYPFSADPVKALHFAILI